MESRGKRLVNLVCQKDREILEIINRPTYETKGIDLKLIDICHLKKSLFKDSPRSSFSKPVAIDTSPTRVKTNEYLESSNVSHYENEDQSQVSSEPGPSNRYSLRRRTELLDNNNSDSDSDSIHDPFEDSGSAYSPSISNASSSTNVIQSPENVFNTGTDVYINAENDSLSPQVVVKNLDNKNFDYFNKENVQPESSESIVSSSFILHPTDYEKHTDMEIKEKTPTVVKNTEQINNNKSRVRDKRHSCYFCQKELCNNLARHIETTHANEVEVAKILAMPKGSKRRREALLNLTKYGDFYHNCEVLATKSGDLILTRRPSLREEKFTSIHDYGPCPECLGFYLKKHIWYHLKYKCTIKLEKNFKEVNQKFGRKGPIAESSALLNGILSSNFTPSFTENVVNHLISDCISDRVKSDHTILRFGAFLYEKYSNTQTGYIRQSMRQVGRLTLKLKSQGEVFESFSEMLIPEKFDAIIKATKAVCINRCDDPTKKPDFEKPTLALKLGYSIKKCAAIERGQSLRRGDIRTNKKLLAFLDLANLEWSVRISTHALSTLYLRKETAADLLPITSDLLKLTKFLENEIKKAKGNLTPQNFIRLQSLTLSRIILFNKRRSGEAAKMTLDQFARRPDWASTGTDEMKNSLTEFEQKLASVLTIIKVIGKKGRIVPILLTKELKESVELLISKRVEFGVLCENPYIFAIPNLAKSHFRGHVCLKKWCQESYLESPERITSTKLRKYVATVCQVFDLSENEYDWLAKHLGHDVRVHREFYRLQENAVELTKVSRLLIAVDQGEAYKYSGKKLKDINLEDMEGLKETAIPEDIIFDSEDEDDKNSPEDGEKNKEIVLMGKKRKSSGSTMGQENPKKICTKRPWTNKEKEIMLSKFAVLIRMNSLPGKLQCKEIIENHEVFAGRKWSDLKYFIKNHLARIKKMTSIS